MAILKCAECGRKFEHAHPRVRFCSTCKNPRKCQCSSDCAEMTGGFKDSNSIPLYAVGHYPRTKSVRAKNAAATRALGVRHPMKDPEILAKATRNTLKAWFSKSAEERQASVDKRSIALKKIWSDPKIKAAWVRSIKAATSTSEYRDKLSRILRKVWKDPKLRSRRSERMLEFWKDRSDPRVKRLLRNHKKVVSSEEYSQLMSKLHSAAAWKKTKLEEKAEVLLSSYGFVYTGLTTASSLGLPISADLVHKKYKVMIQVDGCYWHFCKKHCKDSKTKQAAKKRSVDRRLTRLAEKQGWIVLRFWEHDVMDNADFVKQTAKMSIRSTRRERCPK